MRKVVYRRYIYISQTSRCQFRGLIIINIMDLSSSVIMIIIMQCIVVAAAGVY